MEQHNIDSRFKNSLENLNRQPSADAWARLQKQMAAPEETPLETEKPEEKKRPVWWLSIAAALVLLLASVAVFKGLEEKQIPGTNLATTTPLSNKPETVNNQTVISPDPVTETAPERTEIALNDAGKNTEETVTEVPQKVNAPKPAASEKSAVLAAVKAPKTVAEPAEKPQTEKIITANPEPQLAYQAPEKTSAPVQTSNSDLAGMAIEVIVKKDSPLVASAEVAPDNETENKPNLLKGLFKQAKNLKNGEGLNLADLGLTHDSKLALETRNLQNRVSKVFQN